jgi:hypothetical protein
MIEILDVTQETIIAAESGYERHPESFPLRVFVHVMAEKKFYELLQTGEAITWGEIGPPESLDFWIIDSPTISHMGVHRAG